MLSSPGRNLITHLLPFCSSSEESDEGRRYTETSCYNSGMIDEFVSADVEQYDCCYEGSGVEADGVPIHLVASWGLLEWQAIRVDVKIHKLH